MHTFTERYMQNLQILSDPFSSGYYYAPQRLRQGVRRKVVDQVEQFFSTPLSSEQREDHYTSNLLMN